MEKSQLTNQMIKKPDLQKATEEKRVAVALKDASRAARRNLQMHGLKLPTQGWKSTLLRNRMV